jgi:hypothetical protein
MRVLVAAALLAVALPAAAEDERLPERGPIFALRAGYAVPSGDLVRGGGAVSQVADRKYPLGFQLGYRLTRRIWAQLGFELAPASPAARLCAGGTSCSASDARLGAEVVLRLLPGARVDPWLAAGAGVEVLNAAGRDEASTTGVRTEWSWAGLDLPYLEAGADVAVTDRIGVGPWASVSFARFTSDSAKVEGGTELSGAVPGRTVHRWYAGGLQATLKL